MQSFALASEFASAFTPLRGSDFIAAELSNDGRRIVTLSKNKTAAVWRVTDGQRPTSVDFEGLLLPPLTQGDDNALLASALAPDDATVALSGRTKRGGSGYAVYFFDVTTRTLKSFVDGFKQPIAHLAYADSGLLALALLDADRDYPRQANNIVLFDVTARAEIGRTQVDAPILNIAFAKNNNLLALDQTGVLHRYTPRLEQSIQTQAGDAEPTMMAYSPTADSVAVSFGGDLLNEVRVFDAQTLDRGQTIRSDDVRAGAVPNLGWSQDGENLYLAGTAFLEDRSVFNLRIIDIATGRKAGKDLYIAGQEFFSPYQTATGDIIGYDRKGQLHLIEPRTGQVRSSGAKSARLSVWKEFRRKGERLLRVSPDAREISIGYDTTLPRSQKVEYFQFSLNTRVAEFIDGERTDLVVANVQDDQTPFDDWIYSRNPTVFGRRLQLIGQPAEFAHALDINRSIDPNEPFAIMGTKNRVLRLDARGEVVWERDAPDEVHQIAIADDANVVVTGANDRVIRWRSLVDGRLLLSAYFEKDEDGDLEWAAWTPGGFIDASSGGYEIVGMRYTATDESAGLFFPIGSCARSRRSPEVISTALDGAAFEVPSDTTPTDCLEALAPEIRVDRLRRVADNVLIDLRLVSPEGARPARITHAIAGNRSGDTAKGQLIETGAMTRQYKLPVSNGCLPDSISFTPENADGVGERQNVSLGALAEDSERCRQSTEEALNLHALLIGVSDYDDPEFKDLSFTDDDARALEHALKQQEDKLFKTVSTTLLTGEAATKERIERELGKLSAKTDPNDIRLLFLAGHGVRSPNQGNIFDFLPKDADHNAISATGVSQDSIKRALIYGGGTRILLIDACRSGGYENNQYKRFDAASLIYELEEQNSTIAYASSKGNQVSVESDTWRTSETNAEGHGAFTYALLMGLKGAADGKISRDNRVTHLELEPYLTGKIPELVRALDPSKKQLPDLEENMPEEFPLAIIDQ